MSRKKVLYTYYFTIDKDGQLLAIAPDQAGEGGLPLPVAMEVTAETLRRFAWREGIERVVFEVAQYLSFAKLDQKDKRLQLQAAPVEEIDGKAYHVCATCKHSPAREADFWAALIENLRNQQNNPPSAQPVAVPDDPEDKELDDMTDRVW